MKKLIPLIVLALALAGCTDAYDCGGYYQPPVISHHTTVHHTTIHIHVYPTRRR